MNTKLTLLFITLVLFLNTHAQDIPVGTWKTYFPYNSATCVAVAQDKIYSGKLGLLQYNALTNEYQTFTKVNGLSDAQIINLKYNKANDALIITYQNGNIDIYQNNKFYNIPEIKIANIIASKKVYNIKFINNMAYLATGLGIVVLDADKKEIKATYPMVTNGTQNIVYDIAYKNNDLFAFTNVGIFKANINDPFLQNINAWQLISTAVYNNIYVHNDTAFVYNDRICKTWDWQNTFTTIYNSNVNIKNIVWANNTLVVACKEDYGYLSHLTYSGVILDTIAGLGPLKLDVDAANSVWIGDEYLGCVRIDVNKKLDVFKVQGPASESNFKLRIANNKLYSCAGFVDIGYNYSYSRRGINSFDKNGNWKNYSQFSNYPAMDSTFDILDVAYDPISNSTYATSFGGGLLNFDAVDNLKIIKQNSVLQPSGNTYLCTNLKMDKSNNMWLTVSNCFNNLLVKKADGTWQKFNIPLPNEYKVLSEIVIDNINQKWIILPRSQGIAVLNDNNTIDNKTDDVITKYNAGKGAGNLVSNNVYSLAVDKDNKIWVGTDNGISIINCAESATTNTKCDAENKVVNYDGKNDYLFINESIKAIVVDGGNRKWIATDNGVWLISADAEKILKRFTIENSPLPTNEIQTMELDPQTGVLYIGTFNGLVAYRTESTIVNTDEEMQEPQVFPNPVPANYSGTIAIKGLVDEADVRIVDAAGLMVYKTKALGGQAVWNGLAYDGKRPQSGVYYVFAASADGSVTQQTKFVLMN
jgi:ligand-binding sensor domain-containing protein